MRIKIFLLLIAFSISGFGKELAPVQGSDFTPELETRPDGVLCMTRGRLHYSKTLLAIDPLQSYSLSGEFRLEKGTPPVAIIFAAAQYTASGRRMLGMNICAVAETETKLAASAEAGATRIRVENTAKWSRNRQFNYHVAFDVDPSGAQRDLPNLNLSPALGEFTPGEGFTEIELKSPLDKGWPAGTAVRLHIDRWAFGSSPGFIKLDENWKKLQLTIEPARLLPLNPPLQNIWWPGAEMAGILLAPWPNEDLPPGTGILMRNLELKELPPPKYPDGAVIFKPGKDWKAADTSDLKVKPGSALDLSSLSEIPRKSGRLPRLIIGSRGQLAAEGAPDQQIRLQGTHFSENDITGFYGVELTDDEVKQVITNARRQGYNLMRFYMVDRLAHAKDMSIDMKRLNRLDFFLSEMGRQGVYMHLSLVAFYNYLSRARRSISHVDRALRLYLGEPEMRRAFEYGTTTLLNHVNPYTGLAWKDDPTIACIEFANEIEAGLVSTNVSDEVMELFNTKFRSWLKDKYATPERLSQAWGIEPISDFSQIKAPRARLGGDMGGGNPDLIAFCDYLARDTFDFCEGVVRKTGYPGLTAQFDMPYWFADGAVRFEKSQVALTHKYFSLSSMHAQFAPGAQCVQSSAVKDYSGHWRMVGATRIAGRPLFVTEFNHCYWNPYQHEGGIVFGAYSALQGFDALVIFDAAVRPERSAGMRHGVLTAYSIYNNPISRAGEFLSSFLFLRRDVRKSDKLVTLEIQPESVNEFRSVSLEQSKLGLLCGFSIDFKGFKTPEGSVKIQPDMTLPRQGRSRIFGYNWSIEMSDDPDSTGVFSFEDALTRMRAGGIIPPENISDPAKGILQSDTGEITLRANERVLKVVTPRSEAITLDAGRGEALGALKVANTSVDACVAAVSVDGKALPESKRVVLIYATEAGGYGTVLSPDRTTMIKDGGPPIMLRVGTLDAALKNTTGDRMSLYALGLDGTRREKLPLEYSDGEVKTKLDTAALKHGPTPFFELVAERDQ